ncbi:MAG: aminotransferase class IV, partial [Pseudomonadales bacterium]
GVMSNIFVEHDGCLYTPPQDGAGIAGIMAEQVMVIAHQLGVKVYQQHISMGFLRASAGLFFTNSLNGIWPVIDIAGQAFEVTDMTRQLQSKLVEHIAKHAETW